MIKRTIEVSSGPCRLSVKHGQMQIYRDGEDTATVPCEDIGVLSIDHPAVTYTHGLMAALLENEVVVVIYGKNHLPLGILLPFSANLLQTERLRDQINASVPLQKRLWKQIIQAKIKNQAQLIGNARTSYKKMLALVKTVKSGDKSNVEAHASRIYWQALFDQDKFRRRPRGQFPNNLLDYGYAILRSAVARAICCSGLHPSIGLHHRNRYNPYCLADDLMEPFRPMVDARARILWQKGDTEISRNTKIGLLEVLTDSVKLADNIGPLMVALSRMTASLCRCYKSQQKTLEIPMPWRFPDTESCG